MKRAAIGAPRDLQPARSRRPTLRVLILALMSLG
jgi:hypothetical protein